MYIGFMDLNNLSSTSLNYEGGNVFRDVYRFFMLEVYGKVCNGALNPPSLLPPLKYYKVCDVCVSFRERIPNSYRPHLTSAIQKIVNR